MKKLHTLLLSSLTSAFILMSASSMQVAHAEVLLQNWVGSGTSGFGTVAMAKNDDGSSQEIVFDDYTDLGFDSGVNFFGDDGQPNRQSFFINNNGNITFNSTVRTYTPNPFPISAQPMIAPFWADVDTRCTACGNVYIGSPDEDTLVVTWDGVGQYDQNATTTNTFQLVLIDRADTNEAGTSGNFDVEFRYDDINWTSGSASSGVHAQAGFDAGNNVNFFTVPGSRTAAIADIDIANSNTGTPGIWKFAIRDGATEGETPSNPILPIVNPVTPTDYNFVFEIITPTIPIFIDPDVAIGYDYIVNSGPNFASVLLPTGFDNNLFDVWLWNTSTNSWEISAMDIMGGVEHFFLSSVDRFRITGIETTNMVDPTNVLAFVTGLTFDGAGQIDMNQNAIVQFVPGGVPQVSEPPMIALMLSFGLMLLGVRKLKK